MGALPESISAHFLRLGSSRAYPRGAIIVAEGDRATDVYIIIGGFVRIVNHTASGEEMLIAIRTSGDLVGELAALDGQPRTSTAVAASHLHVRVIDGPMFRSFAVQYPQFADTVSRTVIAKLRSATRYRTERGNASVLSRVARVLEHLAESYGRPATGGVLVDVPLSQRDLASLVGASEPSVVRAYRQLRDAGVIATAYRRVVVRESLLLQEFAMGAADAT